MKKSGMNGKISIRNAPQAKSGLVDLIKWISQYLDPNESELVEIGSYVGDSTEIFAQHFEKVNAIDPWVNGYDSKDAASFQHPMIVIEAQFDEMADKYPNIEKIKATSLYAAAMFEAVDVVYIDGLHTYEGCKKDIETWVKRIRPGGILCGHDYQKRFEGVMRAVNEFRTPEAIFADTSWAVRI